MTLKRLSRRSRGKLSATQKLQTKEEVQHFAPSTVYAGGVSRVGLC